MPARLHGQRTFRGLLNEIGELPATNERGMSSAQTPRHGAVPPGPYLTIRRGSLHVNESPVSPTDSRDVSPLASSKFVNRSHTSSPVAGLSNHKHRLDESVDASPTYRSAATPEGAAKMPIPRSQSPYSGKGLRPTSVPPSPISPAPIGSSPSSRVLPRNPRHVRGGSIDTSLMQPSLSEQQDQKVPMQECSADMLVPLLHRHLEMAALLEHNRHIFSTLRSALGDGRYRECLKLWTETTRDALDDTQWLKLTQRLLGKSDADAAGYRCHWAAWCDVVGWDPKELILGPEPADEVVAVIAPSALSPSAAANAPGEPAEPASDAAAKEIAAINKGIITETSLNSIDDHSPQDEVQPTESLSVRRDASEATKPELAHFTNLPAGLHKITSVSSDQVLSPAVSSGAASASGSVATSTRTSPAGEDVTDSHAPQTARALVNATAGASSSAKEASATDQPQGKQARTRTRTPERGAKGLGVSFDMLDASPAAVGWVDDGALTSPELPRYTTERDVGGQGSSAYGTGSRLGSGSGFDVDDADDDVDGSGAYRPAARGKQFSPAQLQQPTSPLLANDIEAGVDDRPLLGVGFGSTIDSFAHTGAGIGAAGEGGAGAGHRRRKSLFDETIPEED